MTGSVEAGPLGGSGLDKGYLVCRDEGPMA